VPTLSDERDTAIRMQQATTQARQLENFWRTSHDLHMKRVLFLAIPVNTALFGCEHWAMNESLCNKLSVFHHSTIRRVLGTNLFAVERDRVKNEHLQNKLSVHNIADIV